MTPFEIERFPYSTSSVSQWATGDDRRQNWPVVYILDGAESPASSVYVGETVNALSRVRQHIANPAKSGFRRVNVVIDDTFNGLTPFGRSGGCVSRPVARGSGQGDWSDHDEQQEASHSGAGRP